MSIKAEIRELTVDDYEEVIKIRPPEDFPNGMDYLPDHYKMMINLPGYKGFGALIHGKLVAVTFVGLIDGGITAVGRSGRVTKEFEGKRVYTQLHNYAVAKYRAMSGVLWVTATVKTQAAFDSVFKEKVERGEAQLIVKKVIHTYTVNTRDPILQKMTENMAVCKQFDHTDLSVLFNSKELCKELFPDTRITVDSVTYRLMEANIPLIMTEKCIIVGSNIRKYAKCSEMLLTLGNRAVCANGLFYKLDIYGENLRDLKYHIVYHMKKIQSLQLPPVKIQLEFICYETLNKCDIDSILSQFGFRPAESDNAHLYCLLGKYKEDPSLYKTEPNNKSSKL